MQITLEPKPIRSTGNRALVTYVFEENKPIQGRVCRISTSSPAACFASRTKAES